MKTPVQVKQELAEMFVALNEKCAFYGLGSSDGAPLFASETFLHDLDNAICTNPNCEYVIDMSAEEYSKQFTRICY